MIASPTGDPTDAARARHLAAQILAGPRFHSPGLPRPLHGVFQALGGWLRPVGRGLAEACDWVSRQVTGHPLPGALALAVLAVVLVLLAVAIGRRIRRRRPRPHEATSHRPGPRDLRLAAAEAERNGDPSAALRLYFSAAIVELQAAGRLPPAYSLTVGQARRLLGSPRFDRMALAFEETAYGGRPVDPEDLALVRSGTSAGVSG